MTMTTKYAAAAASNTATKTAAMATLLALALLLSPSLLSTGVVVAAAAEGDEPSNDWSTYGVDVSWPIHDIGQVSTNYPWLPHNYHPENTSPNPTPIPSQYKDQPLQPLGDRQGMYDEFMQGCHDYYTPGTPLYERTHRSAVMKKKHSKANMAKNCDMVERDRVNMMLRQPQSMQNYTQAGFQKIKCPPEVYELIKKFWDTNKEHKKMEEWFVGNTYTNHWDSPTYMVSVEDRKLRGGGSKLKQAVWDAARSTIEEWTGQQLTECSLYGIRIYEEGAILSPHVDRLPLVSSAIINVAQDVDEPWPIEVYGHDGVAHNVTMEPGDMVLYESHSVIHGRPFPLKGRFYANIFIHFEPMGHTLRHHANVEGNQKPSTTMHMLEETPDARYQQAVKMGHGGHENMVAEASLLDYEDVVDVPPNMDAASGKRLPPYVVAGSPQAAAWLRENPDGWADPLNAAAGNLVTTFETGSTEAHAAAQTGDVETLEELLLGGDETGKADLVKEDSNGWQPIHEGARAGHENVVEFLVNKAGANVNHRTNLGIGGTPLYWARKSHGDAHPVVALLEKLGALDIGPEL